MEVCEIDDCKASRPCGGGLEPAIQDLDTGWEMGYCGIAQLLRSLAANVAEK